MFNDKQNKKWRQNLRNNSTLCEKIFWEQVRWRRLKWKKRRREYWVWKYTIDFYCHELKLWIELDWSSHIWKEEYDKLRTKYINEFWIKIIRYKNEDILYNLDLVIQDILKHY